MNQVFRIGPLVAGITTGCLQQSFPNLRISFLIAIFVIMVTLIELFLVRVWPAYGSFVNKDSRSPKNAQSDSRKQEIGRA